ncbi:MAG: lamin tail domain-containing protein [Bacteroidetes bacterium]|nr:lamin tail domain-containing protein [Bacteroidota bacterium]
MKFAPNAVQAFSGNITVAATGVTTFNVAVNGTGTTPTSPSIAVVGSLNSFGNVVTGSQSSEQSYTVSGLNLEDNIVITAPSGFSVSTTSGSNYESSLSLTPTDGTVSSTTVYVVYAPQSAAGATGSLNITHASTNATTQNQGVSGTSIATEPTTASTVSFGTLGSTSLVVNFSGGNGGSRIAVVRSGSAVSYTPTDAAAPSGVDADFSAATDQGSGNKIVYNGTGTSVTVSGLSANTTYHVAVYEYNVGTGSSQNYYATAGTNSQLTLLGAPTAIAANSIIQDGFTVRWNSVSGTTYYAYDVASNSDFSTIVVTDSSLTTSEAVTGLSANTTYYYRVRAVNAVGASANSNTITASTAASEPTSSASGIQFANVTNTQMDISWTNGNGANRLVVLRSGAAVNGLALDGKTYTANSIFKSGDTVGAVSNKNYVVYNGSGTSVTVTGLTAGTTYYVTVYEYNGTGTAENYRLTAPPTGNQKTTGSSVASHVVIAEVYGGGGNSGAPYTHDYIILYNPTGSAVNVSTWSVQYASSTGSFSGVTPLTGSIAAGAYYGISLASGATGSALPFTPVVTNTGVNMSGTAGKVALVSNTTAATGVADVDVVDFIGYGTAANEREGTANAPAPSNTSSVRRRNNDGVFNAGVNGSGYDTDDNDRDFYVESNLGTTPALPVEFTSFTAAVKGKGVELAWSTSTEQDNLGFDVERMMSGGWTRIGFVEGHGTTNAPQTYSFTDGSAKGKVQYRLKQIDRDGKFEYTGAVEAFVEHVITSYALGQNYPNPFNPASSIQYQLPAAGMVTLKVYDMLGKEVAVLVNGVRSAGEHTARFDAAHLPSGIYFYTLRTGSFTQTRKMLLMK